MKEKSTIAFAQLNARIMPVARGSFFEDPLQKALESNGLGTVSGGGTSQTKTGEIAYCVIDVDLFDVERGAKFVCEFLTNRHAPRGSKLSYTKDGEKIEMPFGVTEGLGIYLNGTDLPPDVYKNSDINVVMENFNRLLGNRTTFKAYWQGPSETALYLYGKSTTEMLNSISAFMAEYPLCQRARIESIA